MKIAWKFACIWLAPCFRLRTSTTRRMACIVSAAVVLLGAGWLLAAPLQAQVTWSAVPSGTARTLRGVCFGGGQFVAVGDGGTILTSPDGAAWTPRASGTTASLTSVAHALGHYVAVGERGTIVYSRDGIAWTALANTSVDLAPRLNVVRFTANQFIAYGEHDTSVDIHVPPAGSSPAPESGGNSWRGFAFGLGRYVVGGENGLVVLDLGRRHALDHSAPIAFPAGVRNIEAIVFDRGEFVAVGAAGVILTSTDASAWALQASNVTTDLHAITRFNNSYVAVGDMGTVLGTEPNGTWRSRAAPTAKTLLGVAASDTAAVAVGADGTLLRSTATSAPPAIIEPPLGLTESAGGAAAFLVRAGGSLPLQYQWYRSEVALPGETRPWLALAPLVGSDAGGYTVQVTNSAGSVTTAPAILDVTPAPPPLVDPEFRADPAIDLVPDLVLPLSDQRVILVDSAAGRLQRLLPNGQIDTSFQPPIFTGPEPRPAGIDGVNWIEVAAQQSDGRLLVGGGFTAVGGMPLRSLARLNPDGSVDATFAPDLTATAGSILALALQPDGRILIANAGPRVLRLLPDGRIDPGFETPPIRLTDAGGNVRATSVIGLALGPGGAIFAAAEYDVGHAPAGILLSRGAVLKLRADGSLDPTYPPASTQRRFIGMQPLVDGRLMLATRRAEFRRRVTEMRRYRADGVLDETYPVVEVGTTQLFYPDGRVIYAAATGPVRLTAEGAIDPTFTGGIGAPLALARTADDRIIAAGRFAVYHGTPSHRVARLNPVASEAANPPRILKLVTEETTVTYGEPVTVRALVAGPGPLTFDWWGPRALGDPLVARTSEPTITFAFTEPSENTRLLLIARNTRGEAASAPLHFTLLPEPPRILSQPTQASAQIGRDVTFVIWRNQTSGSVEFDWRHNGRPVASDGRVTVNGAALYLPNVREADAGTYTLTLRNVLGATVTTVPIVLTIGDTSRFTNLSARVFVSGDGGLAIAGFVVSGNRGRIVLIRGIGPALGQFGVTNPLADPQLALFAGNGERLTTNDDWDEESKVEGLRLRPTFEKLGAFPLEAGSKDAAFIGVLTPGSYTVHLTGKAGQSGVALLEVYEADNDAARMLNVSTRAFVGAGEAVAVCGLSVRGPVPKRVLLRAIGPTLSGLGVAATLANPRITLTNTAGTAVAMNDDWDTSGDSSEVRAAMAATGAFPLAAGSKDAVILITVPPGNYTILVEGAAGESGIALVEAYEVP